jgi:DNA repair protein RecO (recombination protein O)
MDWTAEGIILGAKAFGENQAIVHILTAEEGRWVGLLPRTHTKQNRAMLYPGNVVQAKWRARLSDQLGTWSLELLESPAGKLMPFPVRLLALETASLLTLSSLAERHPYPRVFAGWKQFLQQEAKPEAYAHFEVLLLQELGFGLDLSRCAVTGQQKDIRYVSPKTGNAVTEAVGKTYADQLFTIPSFLQNQDLEPCVQDIQKALTLTGFFLHKHMVENIGTPVFQVRERFMKSLENFAS